jgi:hypothetical protein
MISIGSFRGFKEIAIIRIYDYLFDIFWVEILGTTSRDDKIDILQ